MRLFHHKFRAQLLLVSAALAVLGPVAASSQEQPMRAAVETGKAARFIDIVSGMTADEAVRQALEKNGEILALRQESQAARSLVKQAGLRPNPTVNINGAKQIAGMDNSAMADAMMPLELGGRRSARIRVADAELRIRELALANQERLTAAEVRMKFGEALSRILKLEVLDRQASALKEAVGLISARVDEGRTPPLEKSVVLVEQNRLAALIETSEGQTEASMFDLRNLIGMKPEEPLRLNANFSDMIAPPPAADQVTEAAIANRPDLAGARAAEQLATVQIEQAEAQGRLDATVRAGYQRMNSSFPQNGIDASGALRPIQSIFNFFTFGVMLNLPVRNRNQGAVEAAVFDREAARRRAEFGALTVRREVSSALARLIRATRALSILEGGVRDQTRANLAVYWQTYELGKRPLSDYITEERRYLETENEVIEAQLETYNAKVDLMRAANAPELTK